MKRALLALALVLVACKNEPAKLHDAGISPTPEPCRVRTAEKLGFPFVHVCPTDGPGYWINATPIPCSAGEHESIRCPTVVAVSHPVAADPAPLPSTTAGMVDADTAARLCYFRMGGHLASRRERSRARDAMGLASIVVTESDAPEGRFRFSELPEWVFEEEGADCENGLPAETCHYGLFPSGVPSTAVAWDALRECSAAYVATKPDGLGRVHVGERCPGSALGDAGADLGCALASLAVDPHGTPSAATFRLHCATKPIGAHAKAVDESTAAYRCVVPENALGTFDLPHR